jgi:hypothetical protein
MANRKIFSGIYFILVLLLWGCGGGGGSNTSGLSQTNTSPPAPAPSTLSISTDSYAYVVGQNITLTWSGVNLTNCSISGDYTSASSPMSGSTSIPANSSGEKIFNFSCTEKNASVSVKVLDKSISIPDPIFADAINRLGYSVINGKISGADILKIKNFIITTMLPYYGPPDSNNTTIFTNTSVQDYNAKVAYTNGKIKDLTGLEAMLNLETFRIEGQNISLIDISPLKKLNFFSLWQNPIESIDLSKNSNLKNVGLSETFIKSIDLSKLVNLEEIVLDSKKDTGMRIIDFSNNSNLKRVYVEMNLKSIIFPKNNSIQELWIGGNSFEVLDLSGMKNLTYIILTNSKELTDLNIKGVAYGGVPFRLYTINSPKLSQIKVTSVQAIQEKIASIIASTPAGQDPALGLYWDPWTTLVNAP